MINEVRTIKLTDHFIYATQADKVLMETKQRRDSTLNTLEEMLMKRCAELTAEEQKSTPDYVRASKLRSIIRNLQNTLKTAQR